MTYKGFTIVLERSQCEYWSIEDNGDALEYIADCPNDHDYTVSYRILDADDRSRGSEDTFEHAKEAIDYIIAYEVDKASKAAMAALEDKLASIGMDTKLDEPVQVTREVLS